MLSESPSKRVAREQAAFIQAELAGATMESCAVQVTAVAGSVLPWRKAEYRFRFVFDDGTS